MVFKSSAKSTVLAYRQNGVTGQCFGVTENQTPLARSRAERGLSRPKLAALAGTSPQQIERLEKGMREMTRIWADRLAPHLGVSPEFLVFSTERKINVVGLASAGGDTITFADAQGPFDEVDAPDWATENTVAVQIRGTSLGRFLDGWIAFYDDRRDPPDESLHGYVCVCGLTDGRVVIKRLRASSAKGKYHLESETEPTMFDVAVDWAARVREMRQV